MSNGKEKQILKKDKREKTINCYSQLNEYINYIHKRLNSQLKNRKWSFNQHINLYGNFYSDIQPHEKRMNDKK